MIRNKTIKPENSNGIIDKTNGLRARKTTKNPITTKLDRRSGFQFLRKKFLQSVKENLNKEKDLLSLLIPSKLP